ncbi:hypothetical protein [Halococcoides cellulosivorans]|uniref:Uncharacterized protein n=1 Tax=Halococcoides cellulosivorans TaxID=1679096 RepID=A0A2R4WZ28_9EURY|nr:hypothetical protein [Halococcoides cellulosivorans]AWB26799.1 hypothetical protein HARCEL1_03245 [Halococcoides cellulosivorans]
MSVAVSSPALAPSLSRASFPSIDDPYRLGQRALAALILLVAVNPSLTGGGTEYGLMAYVLMAHNAAIDYILNPADLFDFTLVDISAITGLLAAGGAAGGAAIGLAALSGGTLAIAIIGLFVLIGALVGLGLLFMYFLLISRQIVVYLTIAILPLLLTFWVFDVGPMKYGKKLSDKLFKATGMLIPLGLIIAALFRLGVELIKVNNIDFGVANETSASAAGGAAPVATDAAFNSSSASMVTTIQQITFPFGGMLAIAMIVTMLMLGALSTAGMGAAANMAAGLAKKGARGGKRVGSKATNRLGGSDSALMGTMGGFVPGIGEGDDDSQSFSSNTGMDDSIADAPEPVAAAGDTAGQEYADVPDDGQTSQIDSTGTSDSTGTADDAAVVAGTEATQTGDSTDERASTGGSPGSPPPDDGETGASEGTSDDGPSTRDLEQRIAKLESKIESLADESTAAATAPAGPDETSEADAESDDGEPDPLDVDPEEADADGLVQSDEYYLDAADGDRKKARDLKRKDLVVQRLADDGDIPISKEVAEESIKDKFGDWYNDGIEKIEDGTVGDALSDSRVLSTLSVPASEVAGPVARVGGEAVGQVLGIPGVGDAAEAAGRVAPFGAAALKQGGWGMAVAVGRRGAAKAHDTVASGFGTAVEVGGNRVRGVKQRLSRGGSDPDGSDGPDESEANTSENRFEGTEDDEDDSTGSE